MYKVTIRHTDDMKFNAQSQESVIEIDAHASMSPPAVLLAGLGSCIGVYIRKYAQGAKLDLSGFSVDVEADFSKEVPVCFREIKVAIRLGAVSLDDRRMHALSEFIKNCPVGKTLENKPVINVEFK